MPTHGTFWLCHLGQVSGRSSPGLRIRSPGHGLPETTPACNAAASTHRPTDRVNSECEKFARQIRCLNSSRDAHEDRTNYGLADVSRAFVAVSPLWKPDGDSIARRGRSDFGRQEARACVARSLLLTAIRPDSRPQKGRYYVGDIHTA